MSESVCREIVKLSGKKLASGDELAELIRLQREYDLALACITAHVDTAAKQDWLKHRTKLQKGIVDGSITTLDGWSLEDFSESYRQKMEVAKEELRRVCHDTLPVAKKILAKFCDLAQGFAADYEKAEKVEFEKFGVPFQPSHLILDLRKSTDFAKTRIPNGSYANSSPRAMLPYLTF